MTELPNIGEKVRLLVDVSNEFFTFKKGETYEVCDWDCEGLADYEQVCSVSIMHENVDDFGYVHIDLNNLEVVR